MKKTSIKRSCKNARKSRNKRYSDFIEKKKVENESAKNSVKNHCKREHDVK